MLNLPKRPFLIKILALMTPVSMNTIYYFLQMEAKAKGAEFLRAVFGILSLN